jgi:uncharacterized protein (DUF924 family)
MKDVAAAVLSFWFGAPAKDASELHAKNRRWYGGGAELDAEIGARFQDAIDRALAEEVDLDTESAEQRLALIVVLDQFTRSVYRDTPNAYAGDGRARALALDTLDRGLDRTFTPEQRQFLLMPLLHAEDPRLQDRCYREMQRLVNEAPEHLRPVFEMSLEQSAKYRDIIARFGRFPHRNPILGRIASPAEDEFMKTWEESRKPSGFAEEGAAR